MCVCVCMCVYGVCMLFKLNLLVDPCGALCEGKIEIKEIKKRLI